MNKTPLAVARSNERLLYAVRERSQFYCITAQNFFIYSPSMCRYYPNIFQRMHVMSLEQCKVKPDDRKIYAHHSYMAFLDKDEAVNILFMAAHFNNFGNS